MKKVIIFSLIAISLLFTASAQKCPSPASNQTRIVGPGTGPSSASAYSKEFICSTCFHFVQFGVYNKERSKYDLRGPETVGEVWLIEHAFTKVAGSNKPGAYYIVKAFSNEMEARSFAKTCKGQGIAAWYNPSLTGTEFELLSITR